MPRSRTKTVEHQYFVRAPTRVVFRAITDPGWLKRWLADDAELELRTGGRYLLAWRDGPRHTGRVVRFVPGKSLTLSWEWDGLDLRDTRLKLAVEPQGGGTLLHLKHSGFPCTRRWMDLYGGTEWGWTYFAMNLKSVLETGHDLRSRLDG